MGRVYSQQDQAQHNQAQQNTSTTTQELRPTSLRYVLVAAVGGGLNAMASFDLSQTYSATRPVNAGLARGFACILRRRSHFIRAIGIQIHKKLPFGLYL